MQLTFDLDRKPITNCDLIRRLEFWLEDNPGWHTASVIRIATGIDERSVRSTASASDVIISGPGSPGYCHARHCPPEEIARIAAKLESQGKAMIARAIRIRRRAHRTIG